MGIGTGAVGSYIVAGSTTVCVVMRQTTITEQSFPERLALRLLGARRRNRPDRLLALSWIANWRLSGRRQSRAEACYEQQSDCGLDRCPQIGREGQVK